MPAILTCIFPGGPVKQQEIKKKFPHSAPAVVPPAKWANVELWIPDVATFLSLNYMLPNPARCLVTNARLKTTSNHGRLQLRGVSICVHTYLFEHMTLES